MKIWKVVTVVAMLCGAVDASATSAVRRFAIVVGANRAAGRPGLRYAVTDAGRFAAVLKELGGVQASDVTELVQPGAAGIEAAVHEVKKAVEVARVESGRVEVVFYYSGHADETGLLLGREAYAYQDLKKLLDSVAADVRIAVLDACGSGAMTRLKGGSTRHPFVVDASSSMRGHAFLTSSSASEAAQESDRIGGSFFTHYLVSGLRGAADTSGEGKVTLNEAYQYAFTETLGRTIKTQGGPQHPAYDIDLTGTGDVVITDLRTTSSSLVLDADVQGRCYVREQKAGILIEIEKPSGRRIELGVGPGRYEVQCLNGGRARVSSLQTEEGAAHLLKSSDFSGTKLDPTLNRGGSVEGPTGGGLRGMNRVAIEGGFSSSPAYASRGFHASTAPNGTLLESIWGRSQSGFRGEAAFAHWIRPRTGLELRLHTHAEQRHGALGQAPSWSDETFVTGLLAGARFELNPSSKRSAPRPYLHASAGPFFRAATEMALDPSTVLGNARTSVELGASLGVGLDLHFGSHLGLGARWSYDVMPEFKDAGIAYRYRGWTGNFATSWQFGKK